MARAPRLLNADLLADLYGAAADDAQWSRMAAIVAGLTGEPGAGLWVVENGVVTDLFLTSPASDAQIPYVAYYHQQDVWQQAILRLPRETVALGYEHTPERYLLRTEFYNDFLRRYGMFRPMGAIIDVAPGTTATVSLERPGASRLFEEDDKAVLEPVIPHLKRALQLRRQLQEQVRHSRALTPALDAVAFGLIVCDARGRVVFANIAAETLAKARAASWSVCRAASARSGRRRMRSSRRWSATPVGAVRAACSG